MKLLARPRSPATEPMPTMVSGAFAGCRFSSARIQSAALVKLRVDQRARLREVLLGAPPARRARHRR